MESLLQAVATALNAQYEPLSLGPNRTGGHIEMHNGVRFFITTGGHAHKGKVRINPSYPSYTDDKGTARCVAQRDFDQSLSWNVLGLGGINISDTKTPEQIAKDIMRRFMPEYEPIYRKAVAYCEAEAKYVKDKQLIEDVVKSALRPLNHASLSVIKAEVGYIGSTYVDIRVSHLSANQVVRLAEFLKNL
jgi:hypothetical protein